MNNYLHLQFHPFKSGKEVITYLYDQDREGKVISRSLV